MDAQERLVSVSEFSAAVLGRAGEFVLVPLGNGLDENLMREALDKNFYCCGYMGVVGGRAVAEPSPHPDAVLTMLRASFAFAELAADWLRPQPKSDAVAWLEALYRLEDPRKEF